MNFPLKVIMLYWAIFGCGSAVFSDDTDSIIASDTVAATSSNTYEPEIRRYTLKDPTWSFQPLVTLNGLGETASRLPKMDSVSCKGYGFQTEFFLKFMHKVGAMSFGAGMLLYQPSQVGGDSLGKTFGLWSFTLGGRYQMRYFREQPIVPFFGFEAENLHYNFREGPNNILWVKGPVIGAMLLLNFLEPSDAADAFVTNGVLRTYIYTEFRTLAGSNGEASVGGRSLFFGFRFEGV